MENKRKYFEPFDERYKLNPKPAPSVFDKAADWGKQVTGVIGSSIAHIVGDDVYSLADNLGAIKNNYNEFNKNLGLPETNPELTRPFARDIGDAAHFVGNKIDENILPMRKPEWSLDYAFDPAGLSSAVAQVLGSVAAIVAPIPFAKRAGITGLSRTLGGYGLENGLAKGATTLPKIAKGENIFDTTANAVSKINLPLLGNLAPYSKGISTGLFTVPMESLAEKGAYLQDALDRGVDYETARDEANGIYLKNLILLSLTNPTQFGILSRLGKFRNPYKALPLAMATEVATQTGEEGWQEGFKNAAEGKPYAKNPIKWYTNPEDYPEQREAADFGTAGTLPLAILGGGIGAYQSRKAEKQFQKDTKDLRDWTNNISDGVMSDETFGKIVREAQKRGVPVDVALAAATAESNGNQNEISDVGAIGVMQLMPETAKSLGVDPYDEDENIRGGIEYLKQQLDAFDGNVELALAAYNAGPAAIQRYGGIPPYSETQNYVNKIMGFLKSSPSYRETYGDEDEETDNRADYDPNFSEKQNQMWQLANYASQRAKSKYNLDIPAFLIYKQWGFETRFDGQDFNSPLARLDNNYGGLKDMPGNWLAFNNDKEFADAYVDDFIRLRPELNGINNVKDFATTMADTQYFPHAELPGYIDGMNAIEVPNTKFSNLEDYEEVETEGYDFENDKDFKNGYGQGKYWIFQNGEGSYEGAQPQTMQAIYLLSKWFYEKTGKPLVVTAVTNGTSHADGEHSHYNGWKFDVNDFGSGAEGTLTTDDFQEGSLAEEFMAYGKSLGLGMNFEKAGTEGVHIDVAVDGTQWLGEDAGKNYGGFNGGKRITSRRRNNAQRQTTTTPNISTDNNETSNVDDNSVVDGIISNLLNANPDANVTFDVTKDRELERAVFKMFVDEKKATSEGDESTDFLNFLQDNNMLDSEDKFKNNAGNRKKLRAEYAEELEEYGKAKVDESVSRFNENQKSGDEKIRDAFEKLVQQEESEGNPEAAKHREILQNGQVGAMTKFLQDAGINLDDSTVTQPQTSQADENSTTVKDWRNFNPEYQQKFFNNLKETLSAAGVLDENLGYGIDNGDENAIATALKIYREIYRNKPIQQIINSNDDDLTDDAKKFRDNYNQLQDKIDNLKQERAEFEQYRQDRESAGKLDVSLNQGIATKIDDIDKQIQDLQWQQSRLMPPQNFKRVSESDQLQSEIQNYTHTLYGLKAQLDDIGEPQDKKATQKFNRLKSAFNSTLDKLWKAQERYDEINDVGKTWREEVTDIESPNAMLNLLGEGIIQIERKIDKIARTNRKLGENTKSAKELMTLKKNLSTLRAVGNAPVNPTLTISQAFDKIKESRNELQALSQQINSTNQDYQTAMSKGDFNTAADLHNRSQQLQQQAVNAQSYINSLNTQISDVVLNHVPQALAKVYGERKVTTDTAQENLSKDTDNRINRNSELQDSYFDKENIQESPTPVPVQQETPIQLMDAPTAPVQDELPQNPIQQNSSDKVKELQQKLLNAQLVQSSAKAQNKDSKNIDSEIKDIQRQLQEFTPPAQDETPIQPMDAPTAPVQDELPQNPIQQILKSKVDDLSDEAKQFRVEYEQLLGYVQQAYSDLLQAGIDKDALKHGLATQKLNQTITRLQEMETQVPTVITRADQINAKTQADNEQRNKEIESLQAEIENLTKQRKNLETLKEAESQKYWTAGNQNEQNAAVKNLQNLDTEMKKIQTELEKAQASYDKLNNTELAQPQPSDITDSDNLNSAKSIQTKPSDITTLEQAEKFLQEELSRIHNEIENGNEALSAQKDKVDGALWDLLAEADELQRLGLSGDKQAEKAAVEKIF